MLMRVSIYTSRVSRKIVLFHVDPIQTLQFEDSVKNYIEGTPLYPFSSDRVESECIRLHIGIGLKEVECGARVWLHGHLMVSVIESGGVDHDTLHFLEAELLQKLSQRLSEYAMKKLHCGPDKV